MTARVTVVDYGSGNILSVSRSLEHCGGDVEITGDRQKIAAAERLVLPGVGAFGKAAEHIRNLGLSQSLLAFAETGRPFLGICVGMQLMLDYGEEFGRHDGLGMVPGRVRAIPNTASDGTPHPVPHIGWSAIRPGGGEWNSSPMRDVESRDSVYFVHSFMAEPTAPEHVLALSDYNGRSITAAISRDNLIGCQFHPEKSGPVGLAILRNFLGLG